MNVPDVNPMDQVWIDSEAQRDDAAQQPMLVVAALWTDGDRSKEVAEALRVFQSPQGFHRGAAVSFTRKVADGLSFRRTMRKLNLEETNIRPEDVERA